MGGGIVVEARDRKARRKERRRAKKGGKGRHQQSSKSERGRRVAADASDDAGTRKRAREDASRPRKRVKFPDRVEATTIHSSAAKAASERPKPPPPDDERVQRKTKSASVDPYDGLDDETAAALRRDDAEIARLESDLGVDSKRGRKRSGAELNREYARNEGFGDDFGDFLMGLDDLAGRLAGGVDGDGGDDGSEDGERDDRDGNDEDGDSEGDSSDDGDGATTGRSADPYAKLDEETALALRNDDAEIARLEEKLGLADSSKARKKLKKEFASTFQGYGEDFCDFLDGLDQLGERIGMTGDDDQGESDGSSGDDGSQSSDEGSEGKHSSNGDLGDGHSSDEDSESEEDVSKIADHDQALTYRPTSGEDIYGNRIDPTRVGAAKPGKYVPPHLRGKADREGAEGAEDAKINAASPSTSTAIAADPETIRLIRRSLNNSLNRLSEQTLESVSKSIAALYSQHPFHDMNDCLWKNLRTACVPSHMVMSGLAPLYVGAVAGVHWLGGDGTQLGGRLVEWSVRELYSILERGRAAGGAGGDEDEAASKEAFNLLLIVCYLYNYGVVHCTLVYDLVRDFIRSFTEIDVESLLVVLGHCGQQLRSDDPSALKEIVLLVKDRAQKAGGSAGGDDERSADSSRVQFMVDTIIELRNNKPRKQDLAIRERTNALKKCIGRLKSSASRSLAGRKGGSCLRVTLRDLLDADAKGRWWIAGASWVGNQRLSKLWDEDGADEPARESAVSDDGAPPEGPDGGGDDDGLLSLAAAQGMNTDARRAAFCIVAGSADCDDAFEKLARGGMLRPGAERDAVRVVVHCCGEEGAYNPFYAHLAARICEFQPRSRFTLTLTFWDAFKQLESFPVRKVANLAKLLAHLIGSADKCLNIGVLKRIEFSPSDMPESVAVFLSVFATALFESCGVESIRKIFTHGASDSSTAGKHRDDSDEDDEDGQVQTTKKEDLSDLRESLSVFLLQYLKPSPKNVKGSAFHSNLLAAIEACDEAKGTS